MEQKLSKKRTGLRPNLDEHDPAKCPIINYFADRNNTELILLKQENEIEKNCFYCNTCKKCKKLKEYEAEFKKMVFWTFNKNIRAWNAFDPDWSIENRVFSMKPA